MYYKLVYMFDFIYHKHVHIPYIKFILFLYLSSLTAELGFLLIGFLS